MASLKLKRIYAPAEDADGLRVLVDGIWPRGMTKSDAGIDQWLKEIAPSKKLREWFGHAPERWEEFKTRYFKELDDNQAVVAELEEKINRGAVTLLYSARDEQHNNAVALHEYLTRPRAKARPKQKRG